MKLRYSEAFLSVQGEGRFVGVPSVFLRTFGCNFECNGFGQPRGKLISKEKMPYFTDPKVNKNHPEAYTSIKQLPVVEIGCDSSASWSHKYKHLVLTEDAETVSNKITNLCPGNDWIAPSGQDTHLVLTGGEPMMWQVALIDLFQQPRMKNLKNLTIETNTTHIFKGGFDEFLPKLTQGDVTGRPVHLTWSCSPKLSISGELWSDAIMPKVASDYASIPNSHIYFKFVVADDQDFEEVKLAVGEYEKAGVFCPVYAMACGATAEGQEKTTKQVARLCLDYGYRYSPRLHIDLFGNAWGT